jgi:hypothetical protein
MNPEAEAVFARDWKRVEALPDGTEKERLKDEMRGMRLILEIIETLPLDDPFLHRCLAMARCIVAGPRAEDCDEVRAELAACVKIARSKMN